MEDYTIYALKVPLKGDQYYCDILSSLKAGEGRFGWSWVKTGDLRELQKRIEKNGWESLAEEEQECYQNFLLLLKAGDWVVYINVPDWGTCTIAKVIGPYAWNFKDKDFNHRFPVDPNTVYSFDRNDESVHPTLSARLKLQGRYWRIYCKEEFEDLRHALEKGEGGKSRTLHTNMSLLKHEIKKELTSITEKIHHTHPNFDLEGLIAEIFRKVPGVSEVIPKHGSGDHGADLLVILDSGLPIQGLGRQQICLVQVKSYIGEHWDSRAVSDIKRAFDKYPEAEMGLIISTASSSTESLERALDKLREEIKKPVSLLIGSDVAKFVLRFID